MIVRRAGLADLPAVIAMLADDALGRGRDDPREPLDPAYRQAFDAILRNPEDALFVAEHGGQAAGCFQLTFLPGLSHHGAWRGQIEGVRVASAHRGMGLGREMMAWAIERCRETGCRLVQLTSDARRTDAHRFYRSLGFTGSHLGMKLTLE